MSMVDRNLLLLYTVEVLRCDATHCTSKPCVDLPHTDFEPRYRIRRYFFIFKAHRYCSTSV